MVVKKMVCPALACVFVLFLFACGENSSTSQTEQRETSIDIQDATGRTVSVPEEVEHIICSGPGCLRLVTYLRAEGMVVGVDDIETRNREFDARPYALANPQFKDMPIFGQFRGFDNPERILKLKPQPDVILKTYPKMGHNPVELQEKTGIPVVCLHYGTLVQYRDQFYSALRKFGRILDREKRANEVIDFFNKNIQELDQRTSDVPREKKKNCYVGGIAFKGPHGFQSTEPKYPPFVFTNACSVLVQERDEGEDAPSHTDVAKEKIFSWNPDVLFLDLSTIQNTGDASALYQLRHDPAYKNLEAVQRGQVYGVLPYNWYTKNFGSILADAYFVGKVLYPERFEDIAPKEKADEIYSFLVQGKVFAEMNKAFDYQAFKKIDTGS